MEDASLERAVTALGEVAGGVFTVPAAVAGYLAKLSAAAVADSDPTEAALRLATIIHQVDAPRAAWYVRLPCSRRGTRQWVAQVLERARTFLRDHALGPPVALSALAQEAGMSPYHLHRYFKAAFGYSPQRYQQQIQLAEAARRLLHSDAAVQEIAAAIGFDDPHYFGKLFKKRLGMRPLAYRAMNTEAPPAPEPLY
jgi:AraC-like DNA-binding protein